MAGADTRRAYRRRERMNQALEWRLQGFTYRQIAREMKISVSTAHSYVEDALKEIPRENAEAVRALHLARYDACLEVAFEQMVDNKDLFALDRVLAVAARIERLVGVDSPKAEDGATETAGMLAQLLAQSKATHGL